MANAQLDHFAAYFVNLGMSVGSDKPNNWDDVLVVKSLLALIYESLSPSVLGKFARPTKKSVVPDDKFDSDVSLLIAHFQGTVMNRPKPQGFINRATAGGKALEQSTIYQLNLRAKTVMLIVGNYYAGKDTVDVLVEWHSSLKALLTKK